MSADILDMEGAFAGSISTAEPIFIHPSIDMQPSVPIQSDLSSLVYFKTPASSPTMKNMSEDNLPSSSEGFFSLLCSLHKQHTGKEICRIPVVGAHNLDLKQLFVNVQKLGGFNEVSKGRKFKQIAKVMRLPLKITNLGHTLKKYYITLIAPVEKQLLALLYGSDATRLPSNRVLVEPLADNDRGRGASFHSPGAFTQDLAVLLKSLLPAVEDGIGASLTLSMSLTPHGMESAIRSWPLEGLALVVSRLCHAPPVLPNSISSLTLIVDTSMYALRKALGVERLAVALMSSSACPPAHALSPNGIMMQPILGDLPHCFAQLRSFHLDMAGSVEYLLREPTVRCLHRLPYLRELGAIDISTNPRFTDLIDVYPRLRRLKLQSLSGYSTRLTPIDFGQVIPHVMWRTVAKQAQGTLAALGGQDAPGPFDEDAPEFEEARPPSPKRDTSATNSPAAPAPSVSALDELVLIGVDGFCLGTIAPKLPRLRLLALSHVHTIPAVQGDFALAFPTLKGFFPGLTLASVFNPRIR
eukprot:gnl/Chilomastix_cuspidata/2093.p1 GENE.gnl/Chilomastix_cuspidata/2093~~gnl/Chilomastix_cuspidata/2093.p1  ORF type:complete len:526 (-),score=149.97 gnl/Chilomastix_cuspidata/2093:391-1968(-)